MTVRPSKPDRNTGPLDDISKAIIEQLQLDGRRSCAAIGKAVGLSEAAVRHRVLRLVDAGVMQVVAVTDPLELGFSRSAMVGIKAEGPLEPIAEELKVMEEVEYVVITAGSFDVLAEVLCDDGERLLGVLSDRICVIKGVNAIETLSTSG